MTDKESLSLPDFTNLASPAAEFFMDLQQPTPEEIIARLRLGFMTCPAPDVDMVIDAMLLLLAARDLPAAIHRTLARDVLNIRAAYDLVASAAAQYGGGVDKQELN